MSAVKGVSSRFSAIKGLITEQNDTNFEPDSMVAAENVIPEINGNLRRRNGLDTISVSSSGETDFLNTGLFVMPATDVRYGAMSRYKWENPNRNFNSDIAVIQVGGTVYFFKYAESLFDNFIEKIDLTADATNVPELPGQPCSYAVVSGYLVIVNRYMNPLVVSCSDTGIVSVETRLNLKMRVTDRLTSGAYGLPHNWEVVDIIERPERLYDNHCFDLRNAGWPAITKCTNDEAGTGASPKSPIFFTKESIDVFPAIADVFLSYKTSSVEEPEALDTFSPWELEKSDYSTTVPPRGHFVTPINSFNMLHLMNDEDVILGADDINNYNMDNLVLSTTERPYQVGALNGHVIFITKDYLGREIMAYSKLVLSPADMEMCYQEADPTADEINDIVPTDGGIIPLSHVPEVVSVTPGLGGLILFTVSGIYLLTGTQTEGFNAASQQVNKISDIACLSGQGVVKLDDRYFFWNKDGLIALGKNQYGDIQVQNLSRGVIDLFVKQFSKDNLKNVLGDVDELTGRLTYTMPTSKGGDVKLNRYKSNIVLILDTQLGGFYYHRIGYDAQCPHIVMPLVVNGNSSILGQIPLVKTTGEYITQTDGEAIKTEESILVNVSNRTIFLCAAEYEYHDQYLDIVSSGLTAAKETEGSFRDWPTYRQSVYNMEGLNYSSFAEFMHKRDANLSAGTNLTTVQSFFKVKDTTGIDFPGDYYSEEDPFILKYSCPIDEDSTTLETYPTNSITGVRFAALMTDKYSFNDLMWYCKGTSYAEWGDPTAQYEYAPGRYMQALPTVIDTDSGGEPFPSEAINYLQYNAFYTDTFAIHAVNEYTEMPGRMVTFTANFQSFGHGNAYPLVGSNIDRDGGAPAAADVHGVSNTPTTEIWYPEAQQYVTVDCYWKYMGMSAWYVLINGEYVETTVDQSVVGWYLVSQSVAVISDFYTEIAGAGWCKVIGQYPTIDSEVMPYGYITRAADAQTLDVQLHQGGVGVNYIYGSSLDDNISPLVMFQNLAQTEIAAFDQSAEYTSILDFIKRGASGVVWNSPTLNDAGLANAVEGYILRLLSRLQGTYANDNELGHLAIDVGQGDSVQIGCMYDSGTSTLNIAARVNGVTHYTAVQNASYANVDSIGLRIHKAISTQDDYTTYQSSPWRGRISPAFATSDIEDFFGGMDNYSGEFLPEIPPSEGFYYTVESNLAYEDALGNVVPGVTLRKLQVTNVTPVWIDPEHALPTLYNWHLTELAVVRILVTETPREIGEYPFDAVLLPSESHRAGLTMTGMYGVTPANDFRPLRMQLERGCGAISNVVCEGIEAITDTAIAASWRVKSLDCVKGVFCLNSETRGNFYVKPIDDFENAINLSSRDDKRAAILGTSTGDPASYDVFINTEAGRACSSCAVGVTDSKVSLYVDFSDAREAGYRVANINAAWFSASCFTEDTGQHTTWIRLDNVDLRKSDYGYNEGVNLYVGSNCIWGSGEYNPDITMGYGVNYQNPLHYSSVSMPASVLEDLVSEHSFDLGVGSYS